MSGNPRFDVVCRVIDEEIFKIHRRLAEETKALRPEFDEIDAQIKATGVKLNRAKMSGNKIAVRDIEKTLSSLFQERKSIEFWNKLLGDHNRLDIRITW